MYAAREKRKGITAEEVQCREKSALREKWKWITAEAVHHFMYKPRLFIKG